MLLILSDDLIMILFFPIIFLDFDYFIEENKKTKKNKIESFIKKQIK